MVEEHVQRRLAAILAVDVVGYSRLMEADETATLVRLKALRREVFTPTIAEFGGRVFKFTGDGAIAEFASAVGALRSAALVQRALANRNAGLVKNQRIEIRIGISLGDVIVEGGDLYGNGVNVAVRMEGLAEPGGICISGSVYEQVRSAVEAHFEDLGTQIVKNIAEPVRMYRVRSATMDVLDPDTVPALPDKPTIAVLPFDNLSGDPAQEYFADGIAEDIITELSRFNWFFVVARNSTFTYKGKAVDVRSVGRNLGARYVLEGSVRRSASRVRIAAQLIDALSGAHLWAEHFDGGLEDVFDLQDRVTAKVVGSIAPRLERAEIERAKRKPTESLDAYDYFLRGLASLHQWT